MSKFASGNFIPKSPEKYVGTFPIQYRSSWELSMMQTFDTHPNILGWMSESISIPYKNPLTFPTTRRMSMYIPDFVVVYMDKAGAKHVEMIEVKPLKETPGYVPEGKNGKVGKVSPRTKLTQIVNAAKWAAAMHYCAQRKWKFRVATEDQLFSFKRKP